MKGKPYKGPARQDPFKGEKRKSDIGTKFGFIGVIIVLILVVGFFTLYHVPKSHRGVVFRSAIGARGFDYKEVGQGWNVKIPFVWDITKMDTRTQTLQLHAGGKGEYGALTPKDINGINYVQDLTIRYRLDENQMAELVEAKGRNVEPLIITAIRGTAREVLGQYAQEKVPEMRLEIADNIKSALQDRLDEEKSLALKDGFILIQAIDVRNTDFNPEIETAIIDKQGALQLAEKAEYQRLEEVKKKEIRIIKAEATREAAITEAQGRSQAIRLEANAKAYGINQVNKASQGMPSQYVALKYAEALKENAEAGNMMLIDFTRMGGNTLGFMDYGKVGGLYSANVFDDPSTFEPQHVYNTTVSTEE